MRGVDDRGDGSGGATADGPTPDPPAARRALWVPDFMAVTWLFPLLWAVFTALRPYSDTLANGYISLPQVINLDNFVDAFTQGQFLRYLNSMIIAVPAVI